MPLQIATFAERPDLAADAWQPAFRSNWPKFIEGDLVAELYYESFFHHQPPFLEYALIAFEEDTNEVLARAFSVPFAFGDSADRTTLPLGGWDEIVCWADDDIKAERTPTAVSAIEVNVHPNAQGRSLSSLMLGAMRDNARRLGFSDLYAPVRPNAKHHEPHTPMRDYARRLREDGLPFDPWLRVHVRAGGRIVSVAPRSMMVAGSLAQWRAWTNLAFDQSGEIIVPGALVPVFASVEHDFAVYVEPNVWVRHTVESTGKRSKASWCRVGGSSFTLQHPWESIALSISI